MRKGLWRCKGRVMTVVMVLEEEVLYVLVCRVAECLQRKSVFMMI